MWYRCITSQRTFLALQAAHAFAALFLAGLGLPSLSSAGAVEVRFFDPESIGSGDGELLKLPSTEVPFSAVLIVAGIL